MTRRFKIPDHEATLNLTITLRDALPLNHLARFVIAVIVQLDLSGTDAGDAPAGGVTFAPEILLGLLIYGYATSVFSSRTVECATYQSIPFRFIASRLYPDHDMIANFRKTLLVEIRELFIQDGDKDNRVLFVHQQRFRRRRRNIYAKQHGHRGSLPEMSHAPIPRGRREHPPH